LKIAVLTSSRADYGIYYPLLKALRDDPFFELTIIAFGTHLSETYGATINHILNDGFEVRTRVDTMPDSDSPLAISEAMGKTITGFSKVWGTSTFDLVFCLGDRYEMFAACASSVPFNVKLAHIHGGEKTTGAIDDMFRHAITHMAVYHFTTTEQYKRRVIGLKEAEAHVYNVGALSIDNIRNMELLSIEAFKNKFNIDLSKPSILITFHPETVSPENNRKYISELIGALEKVKGYQFIITMPNADTSGRIIRDSFNAFIKGNSNAVGVESFGALGYLSCMKHCAFMLGNTSSGFVEAFYLQKYVINLGDRQNGRIVTENIFNCPIDRTSILDAIHHFGKYRFDAKTDVYGNGDTAERIIKILQAIQ
jgi:GDP/UDP-N,N'-diacetylbacillosamine 2-epimerase (hydrolysing)